MEKLLKILKVCFYTLLFALAITLVVCLFTIPTETKAFIHDVMVFINQPLPIIGVSIFTGGFLIYKIIDITPIGRKGYNAIKNDLLKEKDKINGYKQVAEERLKELETTKDETIALLEGYSERIDTLESELLKVCETSPNAKIKALGYELKEKSDELKVEIDNKHEQAKNGLAKTIEIKESKVNELEKELAELKALVLSNVEKAKESAYGEEETKND